MTLRADEVALIEARRLRDMARGNVRTNLDTLRRDLAERPLTARLREAAITTAVDTAENAINLALENRAVLGGTLASVIGWLFRKPLGRLGHSGCTWVAHHWSQWRD